MPRTTVTADFTFPLHAAPGKVCAELWCCATADVIPGGEVVRYRDVMIDCGTYGEPEWVEPDNDMRLRVLAYLNDGHADLKFEEAALDAGGYADYRRDLMAAQ